MDSPISSPDTDPQRMSALYHYHNAPEVAPVAGLEWDDRVRPFSDKYPVTHTHPASQYPRKGSSTFSPLTQKPPLIIFGMKVRTFLVVTAILVLIVVGAAVGGAVGGKNLRSMDMSGTNTSTSSATTTQPAAQTLAPAASASSTSTYSAPTPTYTPLNDCPLSNNTIYTPGTSIPSSSSTKETFTKSCDTSSPLTTDTTLAEAFVYSFNDCIELCAALNAWGGNRNCSAAVYKAAQSRPANCWVGGSTAGTKRMAVERGTSVALLVS